MQYFLSDLSVTVKQRAAGQTWDNHVSPTMKEFIAALEGANITTKLENGKIHLRREVKRPWPFKPETINYSIGFAGWSRSVGAKTAREVLQKLKLYEEYPDYQDFLEGKEPMYQW